MTTIDTHAIPYGLREVELRPVNNDGTRGDWEKLPASRTFSFTESEEYEELRGDDRVITARGQGATVEWELEGGGISLPAYKVINGGEITEEFDIDSNMVSRTYTKKVTDSRPFFEARGRAISDAGGDFHSLVYRCRATGDVGGSLGDGEFLLTNASGQGFADPYNDDRLYDFIQNAEETPINPPA